MAKPKPEQIKTVKCRGWNELCSCIRNDFPDLKVKVNNRPSAVNAPNLKSFLQQKGLIESNGEPSFKCVEAQWIFNDETIRLTHERKIFESISTLAVTAYGYGKIIRLLQGKRVKFPKGRQAPRIPDLTIKQIDMLRDLQIETKANIKDYVIVGANLIEIQSLIKLKGRSFGDYTQKHFGFDYRRASQFMEAVETMARACKTDVGTLKMNNCSHFKGHFDSSMPSKDKDDIDRMKKIVQNKESILDIIRKKEAKSSNSRIQDVLQVFDTESKVRAMEWLSLEQQQELVEKLLEIQSENGGILTAKDIKAHAEQYRKPKKAEASKAPF